MTFRTRPATVDDRGAYLRLFPELKVDDPAASPAYFAGTMVPRTWVLESDEAGHVVGYAFSLAYGESTHLVHLVVDPALRGRRGADHLLGAVRAQAVADGASRWFLNVKQDNAPAIRAYERRGFRVDFESFRLRASWEVVSRLPLDPGDARPCEVAPDDDAEFEASLGIDRGRLRVVRPRDAVVITGLREGGEPVGCVAFDPTFPGVYPFRVARPPLARVLLEAVRPFARSDRLGVVVERDLALRDLFLQHGAALDHAIFRMSAPLAGT